MPSMTGTFKLIKSDKFDEFLKAIWIPIGMRRLFASALPTTHITNEQDNWNITTSTSVKTTEIKFKLGEEFDETTEDGRSCKSVITKEGENKLVRVQRYDNLDLILTIVREFTDTGMKMTLESPEGITSTRIFERK